MNYLALEYNGAESLNNIERKKFLLKSRIVRNLYVKGPKSNADLCSLLNISSPTSISLLNELIDESIIEKQGRGRSIGGRKPDLYGLQKHSLFVLSISIEKYKTRIAIFDNDNNIINEAYTFRIEISKNINSAETLYNYALQVIQNTNIDENKLVGISISMPGLTSSKEGKNFTYFIPQDNSHSLKQIFQEKFKKPVYIQNDAKCATLAELCFGLGVDKKNVLMLSIDWGIGLGIVADGKLMEGTTGFSGEFGHIPISDDGILCHCGKRGCLETVASCMALVRMAKEGIRSGESSILGKLSDDDIEQLKPQHIIDAANNGDQYAINLLAAIGVNLGKGIAILIQIFNPELIILGGKIAEANQFISVPIQHSINTYCMKQLSEKTTVVLSNLGSMAGILGPVATFMNNIIETPIDQA